MREIIRQWVEALRSDQYVQITGLLRRPEEPNSLKKCCVLGVACDVIDPTEWNPSRLFPDRLVYCSSRDDYDTSVPPHVAQQLFGSKGNHVGRFHADKVPERGFGETIDARIRSITDEEKKTTLDLSDLNDRHNFTLVELASVIETVEQYDAWT